MPKKRRKAALTETTPDIPFHKVRVEWVDCVSDSAWASDKEFKNKSKVSVDVSRLTGQFVFLISLDGVEQKNTIIIIQ